MIGVWTAELFQEIYSTTKLKGWVETALQSGNLSQQHNISTGKYVGWTYQHIRKKKKVCYKNNITDFAWNTFLLEEKFVWYNHQHYPI